jgi:hypothetical protein
MVSSGTSHAGTIGDIVNMIEAAERSAQSAFMQQHVAMIRLGVWHHEQMMALGVGTTRQSMPLAVSCNNSWPHTSTAAASGHALGGTT